MVKFCQEISKLNGPIFSQILFFWPKNAHFLHFLGLKISRKSFFDMPKFPKTGSGALYLCCIVICSKILKWIFAVTICRLAMPLVLAIILCLVLACHTIGKKAKGWLANPPTPCKCWMHHAKSGHFRRSCYSSFFSLPYFYISFQFPIPLP